MRSAQVSIPCGTRHKCVCLRFGHVAVANSSSVRCVAACRITFVTMSWPSRLRRTVANDLTHVRKYLTPMKDVPGYDDPSLIDPERWAKLESADIKFALKEAVNMYIEGWRSLKPQPKADPNAEAVPPIANTDSRSGPEHGTSNQHAEATEWIMRSASHLGGAIRDPAARERLMKTADRYATYAKDTLDGFLAGYVDGKNEQLRKIVEQKEAGKAGQEGSQDAATSASASASTAKESNEPLR